VGAWGCVLEEAVGLRLGAKRRLFLLLKGRVGDYGMGG
jgi:hypothetical protein